MISKYSEKSEKLSILKILGFPLQKMITASKMNRIDLNNGFFKSLDSKVPGNFSKFLTGIGFTKKSDTVYEFELPKDDGEQAASPYSSNQTVLETVGELFEIYKKQD